MRKFFAQVPAAILLCVAATSIGAQANPSTQSLYEGKKWRVKSVEIDGQNGCLMSMQDYHGDTIFTVIQSDGKQPQLSAWFNEADLRNMQRVHDRVVEGEISTVLLGEYAIMAETGHRILSRNSFRLPILSTTPKFEGQETLVANAEINETDLAVLFDILTDPQVPAVDLSISEPAGNEKLLEMRVLDLISGDGDAFFFFEMCAKNLRPRQIDDPDSGLPNNRDDTF